MFTDNMSVANAPLVSHVLYVYAEDFRLLPALLVTVGGALALLMGGLSLRWSGLRQAHGVAALIGAVAGGVAFAFGLEHLSFLVYVTY